MPLASWRYPCIYALYRLYRRVAVDQYFFGYCSEEQFRSQKLDSDYPLRYCSSHFIVWVSRKPSWSVIEFKEFSFKVAVFCVVTPCSVVEVYRRIKCAYYDRSGGGSIKHLWNVGILSLDYTAEQHVRQPSSYSLPREPEISRIFLCLLNHLFV
jgi:hypothetical protein